MAHIITIGNEKGGAGKSTVSMHVATALARMGHRVGALDLDLRQQSLGRFFENRAASAQAEGLTLPGARLYALAPPRPPAPPERSAEGAAGGRGTGADAPDYANRDDARRDDARLAATVAAMAADNAFVVIDCPGSHTRLSQRAHAMADTLLTPLNDSFVDFDLLARLDGQSHRVLGPSVYSEMVWSARQQRALAGRRPIDWVVLRNRLGSQAMHNKARMQAALKDLSRRIGFRVAPGLSERVIFRELFPRGLTLLDLPDIGVGSLNLSNIAARQELREMLKALRLPGVAVSF